jgi:hypothetical protein
MEPKVSTKNEPDSDCEIETHDTDELPTALEQEDTVESSRLPSDAKLPEVSVIPRSVLENIFGQLEAIAAHMADEKARDGHAPQWAMDLSSNVADFGARLRSVEGDLRNIRERLERIPCWEDTVKSKCPLVAIDGAKGQ